MSTSLADLALPRLLHEVTGGGSTDALLRLVAVEGARAMDSQTSVCAVVLGGADVGLAVHASSEVGSLRSAVEELVVTGPVLTTAASGAVSTVNNLDDAGGRWAAWAGGAREVGYRGMRSWPVQVAASPIGALVVLTTDSCSRAAGEGGGDRSTSAGPTLADGAR